MISTLSTPVAAIAQVGYPKQIESRESFKTGLDKSLARFPTLLEEDLTAPFASSDTTSSL